MEKRELVGKTWLGERIVAWRGADGRVCVADAACPHVGADLRPEAGGRVRDGRLGCPFHAYEYGVTGQCVAIPYAPPPAAEVEPPVDTVGRVALAGFVPLLILTLNRKVPCHRWYSAHRLMGLFFAAVALHVLLVLYDGEDLALESPPGAALAVLLLAGLAAYAWRQVFEFR